MAAPPYMPFYIGDYLGDTHHLTTAEHGAYLLLVMAYWQRQRPLPDDDRKLASFARMSLDTCRDVRPILEEFFQAEAGVWHHKRIDAEIKAYGEKRLKAQRAANARYAKARRMQESGTAPAAMADSQPEPESDSPPLTPPKGGNADSMQGFDAFWEAFADKRGKDAALRVWKRRKLYLEADAVITGAQRYVAARGPDRRYWKQAGGWLKDGRWADETPAPDPPGPTRKRGGVWILAGTPEWEAWAAARRRPWPSVPGKGGEGWFAPSRWPPPDGSAERDAAE